MKQIASYLLPTLLGLAAPVFAAAPNGLSRTVVKSGDVGEPGYQAVIARISLLPGGSSGRHTHPGDEISYVTAGRGELLIDGEPTQQVSAGQGIIVPTGKVHEFRNVGSQPLSLVGVFYVKKGPPLATPAN